MEKTNFRYVETMAMNTFLFIFGRIVIDKEVS